MARWNLRKNVPASRIVANEFQGREVVRRILEIPSLLSVSLEDLIKEQKADSTLVELFDPIVPIDSIVNLSSGYYLEDECWFESGCHMENL